jgi:hypothetical protein
MIYCGRQIARRRLEFFASRHTSQCYVYIIPTRYIAASEVLLLTMNGTIVEWVRLQKTHSNVECSHCQVKQRVQHGERTTTKASEAFGVSDSQEVL